MSAWAGLPPPSETAAEAAAMRVAGGAAAGHPEPAAVSHPDRVWLDRRHHALRQPLNALALLCEVLRMRAPVPGQAPLIDDIVQAVQSIEASVDALFRDLGAAQGGSGVAETGAHRVAGAEGRTGVGTHAAAQAEAGRPACGDPAQAGRDHRGCVSAVPPPVGPTAAPSCGAARLADPASPREDRRDGRPATVAGCCIVVVDDDDVSRIGLGMLLEGLGARTLAFSSVGAVADWLATAPRERPDLAVMDYHLPRAGQGLEALRLLRGTWPDPPLPALLITGDERAAASCARQEVALECLVKPVQPEALRAALRERLGAGP